MRIAQIALALIVLVAAAEIIGKPGSGSVMGKSATMRAAEAAGRRTAQKHYATMREDDERRRLHRMIRLKNSKIRPR